jgi:hypothetical protein
MKPQVNALDGNMADPYVYIGWGVCHLNTWQAAIYSLVDLPCSKMTYLGGVGHLRTK